MLERRHLFATLPSGLTETVVASNLTSPITMDIDDHGNIWVAYQDGRIEVIKDDVLLPTPAIQLDVDSFAERGLEGIELDPDFETNHYLYVFYTAARNQSGQLASHNRLSRLTVDSTTHTTIVPGSELILLEFPEFSTFPNDTNPIWRMGGAVHFLPDKTLLVQVGDAMNPALVQNNNTPMGKVLRLNRDGSAPTNNPFYNAADTNPPGGNDWNGNVPGDTDWVDYIWATGLRNPFAGDVDPETGRYFVCDVGQSSWEEINDATMAGRNFGWPTTEGNFNPASFPNFTNPFYTYSHSTDCAITGGAFYSPAAKTFPTEYHGKFFFSKFCAGTIEVIDPNNPANRQVFASGIAYPMNIEFAADGSMYYIERGAGANGDPGIGTGRIVKIQNGAAIPPQIVTHPSSTLVSLSYDATFTVSAAGTPPISYQWQRKVGGTFVDIVNATSNTYVLPDVTLADDLAQFRVIVTNQYSSVASNVATLDVTLDTPPTPVITLPLSGATYRAGDTIQFSGLATDLENGLLPASALTWQVDFHHDTHLHPFMPPTSGITGGQFTIPTTGETASNVWYRVRLIATDSAGLKTETFRDIYPLTSDFVVTNNLGGGTVLIDSQTKSAPYITTGVENVTRSLEAPLNQSYGGHNGVFLQWLDGETDRQRFIQTPQADSAYVAIYEDEPLDMVFVSDLVPANNPPTNGYGPVETDMSNGENSAGDGGPLTIGGIRYFKGLGVHAASDVRYNLDGNYTRFIADIGVDDEVGNGGSVVFQVLGDGVPLYTSSVLTGSATRQTVDVNVSSVNELRLLVTNGGDGNSFDHADWGNARLIPQVAGSDININFQLDAAAVPAGYLKDSGQVFGNRGNGYSYGWSTNHTDASFDRNVNADQRLDTHIQFHAGATWEIALPDGAYAVTVVVGDASASSTNTLYVEGTSFWSGFGLAANRYAEKTLVVTVADGRLTLSPAGAAESATRIDYLEIIPLSNGAGILPLASADLTLNGKLSYADVLAFSAGWGNHTPGATLQQLVNAGDLNFDGTTNAADWALFNQAWTSAGMPALSLSAVLNPAAGDYNRDTLISDNDLGVWTSTFAATAELAADGTGDGVVDAADYVIWRKNAGTSGGGGSQAAPQTGALISTLSSDVAQTTEAATDVSRPFVPETAGRPRAFVPRVTQPNAVDRFRNWNLALVSRHAARDLPTAAITSSARDEALDAFDAADCSQLDEELCSLLDDLTRASKF